MIRPQQWHETKYQKPRAAHGGIKARTLRGRSFALHWWSRRWMEILEQCIDPTRLTRGKSYARKGQVLSIDIEPGLVSALVQGTRKSPYQIKLGFETVSPEARELLVFRFREHASFAAKLLSGEMPEEMEDAFGEAGVPLFPNRRRIMTFKCTCPEDDIPCKHIIAVLLLLAEVFDDDPFLLLKLRGFDRDSMISLLSSEVPSDTEDYRQGNLFGVPDEAANSPEVEGGSENETQEFFEDNDKPDLSWYGGKAPSFQCPDSDEINTPAALGIMNEFPFWRGAHPFRQSLRPYYDRAANHAYEILTGEKRSVVGRPRKLI